MNLPDSTFQPRNGIHNVDADQLSGWREADGAQGASTPACPSTTALQSAAEGALACTGSRACTTVATTDAAT